MAITTTRLAAPLAVAAALPFLAWCQRPPEPAAPEAPAPETPTVVLDSTLNRAALLAALTEARAATADGRPRDAALNGRTVSVRLPFGCEGAGAADHVEAGLPSVVRGADGGLMLTVSPEDLSASALIGTPGIDKHGAATSDATSKWEAIEGFWIPRPWSGLETCAPRQAAAAVTAPEDDAPDKALSDKAPSDTPTATAPLSRPERSAGLAAVMESGGSRLGRRQGQAYAHVIRGEKGAIATPAPGGYALRLEGRLTAFADGKAVHCVQQDAESRPVCVAALRLDRLAFEDGATGAVLSEWRPH